MEQPCDPERVNVLWNKMILNPGNCSRDDAFLVFFGRTEKPTPYTRGLAHTAMGLQDAAYEEMSFDDAKTFAARRRAMQAGLNYAPPAFHPLTRTAPHGADSDAGSQAIEDSDSDL